MVNLDNGYVSNYLIHWTGRKDDSSGLNNLLSILRDNRLKFGIREILEVGLETKKAAVELEMVCFTDVPIRHSYDHCKKYGRFGIAFEKKYLADNGAQPVFYYTPLVEQDVKKVIRFMLEDGEASVPLDIFKALQRHFCFSQPYSGGGMDSPHASYYEREWRLCTPYLDENYGQDGVISKRLLEGEPMPLGKLEEDHNGSFFPFKEADISFVVVPSDYEAQLRAGLPDRQLHILHYEDFVSQSAK